MTRTALILAVLLAGCSPAWAGTPTVINSPGSIVAPTGGFNVVNGLSNTTAALAFGVPPCGTPEAKTWRYCLVWKLVDCPRSDPRWPWVNAQPYGCPLPDDHPLLKDAPP